MPWPPARHTARNDEIVREYLGGDSTTTIARRRGMTVSAVTSVLSSRSVTLPPGERRRRAAAQLSRNRVDLDCETRRVAGIRSARTVWPDCPADLRDEYMRLRRNKGYTAAEARAMLEADMRKNGR